MTMIQDDRDTVHRALTTDGDRPTAIADVVRELVSRGHTVESAIAVVESLIASGDIVLTNTYALQVA